MRIILGQKVKDIVTGFTGIAVAKCEYLNGCIQFQVVPRFSPESGIQYRNMWIDESQLSIEGEGVMFEIKNIGTKKAPGGGKRSHPS